MRIACLAPDDEPDYPPIFADRFKEFHDDLVVEGFYPHDGGLPESTAYDGVVVTGSRFHVYDEQDWVAATQDYVRTALDDEVPVLGVCYGHQLVAAALGGAVGPLSETDSTGCLPTSGREMGYNTVTVTAAGSGHPLFMDMPDAFTVFGSHLDCVMRLPEDAILLAENEYGVQAFAAGHQPAYGIQFHPEYSLQMARELVEQKELDTHAERIVTATLTESNAARADVAERVLGNFVGMLS